ncbi:hypothetical protein DsansV1_C18g0154171 [Dioscorea sansibarensis]
MRSHKLPFCNPLGYGVVWRCLKHQETFLYKREEKPFLRVRLSFHSTSSQSQSNLCKMKIPRYKRMKIL